MPWQDIIITIGTFIFAIALIPTLRSKDKPPVSTSLTTGITLIVFALTFASLGLWFSCIMNLFTGSLWLTLALQKHRATKQLR
jgi:hypothetical protein